MKVIDFSQTNSILNQYISEIRNVEVQNDRLRFRRNIERIGEIMAYEMSKEFRYSVKTGQPACHQHHSPRRSSFSPGFSKLFRRGGKRIRLCLS